jgi:hypothetical protein
MDRTELARKTIATANKWRREGNLVRDTQCTGSGITDYLAVAVLRTLGARDAISWLRDCGVPELLERYWFNCSKLSIEVDSGRQPISVIAGNFFYFVFAHLAWALDDSSLGEGLVRFANRPDVKELSTPFWNEYAHAMQSLVDGAPYAPPSMELNDLEKYWYAYIDFISAASSGGDVELAIKTVDAAFIARNQDKSLTDDIYETEGSGARPVKWDYRRDGLLAYIRKAR